MGWGWDNSPGIQRWGWVSLVIGAERGVGLESDGVGLGDHGGGFPAISLMIKQMERRDFVSQPPPPPCFPPPPPNVVSPGAKQGQGGGGKLVQTAKGGPTTPGVYFASKRGTATIQTG